MKRSITILIGLLIITCFNKDILSQTNSVRLDGTTFFNSISLLWRFDPDGKRFLYCCKAEIVMNLNDVMEIFNDATGFITGCERDTDINDDEAVNLTDISITYNNSINFVAIMRP